MNLDQFRDLTSHELKLRIDFRERQMVKLGKEIKALKKLWNLALLMEQEKKAS